MTSDAPYPPAEQPADGDRTGQVPPPPPAQGRYSASASVPVPPPSGQPGNYGPPPSNPIYPPATYGQATPPPGQGGPVSGQGPGQAAGPSYGGPPGQSQGHPGQPHSGPSQGHPGQGRPSGPAQYSPQPPQSPWSSPPQPTSPGGYGTTYGQPTQPFQSPPPPGSYGYPPSSQPAPMGQGGYPPPGYPQGEPSSQPGIRTGEPTGGWPYLQQAPEPVKPRRRWPLFTVIGVIAVLLIGGAAAIGYEVTHRGDNFKVGACVQQDGSGARVVSCSTQGAYQIVSIVDSSDKCPSADQPSVLLSGGGRPNQVACLKPSAG